MKTVLVTGASGMLGSHIVKELIGRDATVYAAIMPVEKETYKSLDGVKVVLNDDIFAGNLPHIDVVINCAFSRSNVPAELASGLEFTTALIKGFEKCDIDGIINVSSQGVYKRLPVGELSDESSPIEPIDTYSMAKFAAERMFELAKIRHYTNVRLASICMKQRFLYKFVDCARSGRSISLNSPGVYASLLHVKDAVRGLVALALTPVEDWKHVYNLGTGTQHSLAEYAEAVIHVAAKRGLKADVVIEDNGASGTAGVCIDRLCKDTGWKPEIGMDEMIDELFNI